MNEIKELMKYIESMSNDNYQTSVRIKADIYNQIEMEAEKYNASISKMINVALMYFIDNNVKEE